MENQSPDLNIGHKRPTPPLLNLVPQSFSTPALLQHHQEQAQPQPQPTTSTTTTTTMNGNTQKPYLRIVEQPAKNDQRFRYVVEGRSAGSIKGVNWTPENNTYPTIEIVNYNKQVIVVVSCVTKDKPYRPHPHKVVGRDGGGQKYKSGICELTMNEPPFRASFSNLGIQCTKKKDMEESLEERRTKNINPFNTPYSKDQKLDYALHEVRLCFQAFINPTGIPNAWVALEPVVSDPIIDKKAITDLVICQLCSCAAKPKGGERKILLCDKVDKSDIRVKFTELDNQGSIKWCAYADLQPQDIHKNFAIAFNTPRYARTDISSPVKVFIQLERPSDKALSKPVEFEYHPDPGMSTFTTIRRKIKSREEHEIFQEILALDSETTASKYFCPLEICNDDNETVSSDSSASKPNSSDPLYEYEAAIRRRMYSDTDATEQEDIDDADIIRPKESDIEFEVPQINFPVADECTQTSTLLEDLLKQQQLTTVDDTRPISTVDKITEWMRCSEFERTDSLIVENGDTEPMSPVTVPASSTTTDDDQTFTELMEQVAEFDDILSRRSTLEELTEIDDNSSRRNTLEQITEISEVSSKRSNLDLVAELGDALSRRSTLDGSTVKEFPLRAATAAGALAATASTQPSVELDENFDETATYTSLKIAMKNPIDMPTNAKILQAQRKLSELSKNSASTDEDMAGLVVLTNPPAPKIQVNAAQIPSSPPSPPLPLPPRTPSPGPEQIAPPLPPKRRISHELNVSNNSTNSTPNSSFRRTDRNGSLPIRSPSEIIILRTPDQSPSKRQLASPTPTASPNKKQGFFARLFSRKSKPDIKLDVPITSTPPPPSPPPPPTTEPLLKTLQNDSKSHTPETSREPSIGHFSLADPNRSSLRSAKSLQPNLSPGLSPHSSTNVSVRSMSSKPVGRSSSSVSGKRPNYLNADVIHIPLKGDETEQSPTISTFGRQLDLRTLSALQLADIPVCEGNMELVAIADRQSIKNLCEGDFGIVLDPSVDLGEAEHFALYTSVVDHDDQEGHIGNGGTRAMDDSYKRKRIRSSDDVRNFVSLQTNGQFSNSSTNGFTNPFGTTPELKVEQMTSPEYYANQNSPYSMVQSPSPQSPMATGMQYITLTTSQNSTNPFLSPISTDVGTLPTAINQLPSMSGGSFTPLCVEQPTSFNIITNTTSSVVSHQINPQELTDSSEMTSEGRLVNRLANQLEADANANTLNNAYNYVVNILNTPQPETVVEEEGLTTSGLINMLDNAELLQMANLSVAGNS